MAHILKEVLASFFGSLIGTLDGGKTFFGVGTNMTMTVLSGGSLSFVYWDSNHQDNSGSIDVTVQVFEGPEQVKPIVEEEGDGEEETLSGIFSIESVAKPGHFLRMDPAGVPPQGGNGGGTVKIQNRSASLEKIKINPLGNSLYNLESVAHPGRFLRMSTGGVPPSGGNGGGLVNIQNRAASLEKFRINKVKPNVYSIESAATPNRFLRMDSAGVPPTGGNGGGTVNVQNRVGSMEVFRFVK